MRLLVSTEERFLRTPDGRVWTGGPHSYRFWSRYVAVFDEVAVLARVRDVPSVRSDWSEVAGPSVTLAPVPYYVGPWQYLRRRRAVTAALIDALRRADAVVVRVGSHLAGCMVPHLRRRCQPYAVEVIGDPYDAFAPGAVRHPFRPALRWHFVRQQRGLCAGAIGAAYVTTQALQRRYPCGDPGGRRTPGAAFEAEVFTTSYSDVDLADSEIVALRQDGEAGAPFQLVTVASLEQLYKGVDVLIDAIARCAASGVQLRLSVVGDGRYRPELEQRAQALGVGESVTFLGTLPKAQINGHLDSADLFVLASRAEGLPRALIEAMARGLPCIATAVGGMPELLSADCLVPPDDPAALATLIAQVASDPSQRAWMSRTNLEKAREFRPDSLRDRRLRFYRHVRRQTELWQGSGGSMRVAAAVAGAAGEGI